MSQLSLTDADRDAMLAAVGVASVDDLFGDIPDGVRLGATWLSSRRSPSRRSSPT